MYHRGVMYTKRLLALVSLTTVFATVAFAQAAPVAASTHGSPFAYSAGWDFHVNKPIGSVSYTAESLPNTFGIKGLNFDGVAFTGAITGQSGLLAGPGLGLSKLVGNVTLAAAGAFAFNTSSGKTDLVVFVGVRGSF